MRVRTISLATICLSGVLGCVVPVATADGPPARVVEIHAKKFEFTPSEIRIKHGEPVTLRLVSSDRTHGFFQRELGIDTDIEHNKPTDVTVEPEKPGSYDVICDHYCGYGHSGMKMTIIVE